MRENSGTNIAEAERFYYKAIQAIEKEQYDYALRLFESALSLDPNFAKARDGLKITRIKKYESLSEYRRKMKGSLLMIQAFFYEKLGRWERAAEKYEELFSIAFSQAPILPHLGDAYRKMGMTSRAIETYQAALQLEEDNLYTFKRLGETYLKHDKMKEAKYYYEKVLALKPEDTKIARELKNLDALLTINKGKWEEKSAFTEKTVDKKKERGVTEESGKAEQNAGEAVKKKTELEPAKSLDIETNLRQAATYLDQNRIDEASSEYKKILEVSPDDIRAHQALGEIYIRERYFDEAIEEYEKVVKLDPTKKALLDSLANLYIRKGEIPKAIEKYEQIIFLEPQNPVTHRMLGEFYLKQGNKERALALYEKATELDSRNPILHRLLGNLYLENGELDKAIAAYEKVALLEPDKTAGQEKLGDLYLKKEDFEKAKESYKKVLEAEPDHRKVPRQLKEIDLKKLDILIRENAEVLKFQPDNSEAKEKMKKAHQDKLNLQIKNCQEKIKECPEDLTQRFELGKLYKEKGEVDKALAEFQVSANEPRVKRQSFYMIGICFEAKNILDMAAGQFQKALGESPGVMDNEAKETRYRLGQLYEKMGEREQALSQYKKIYETDIIYKDVARKIEAAYKKQ